MSTVYIGDSLSVGTRPYLKGIGYANTVGGRSSADGIEALRGHARGDQYILDLGTNDSSAALLKQSIKRAAKITGGAPIYMPKLNGPKAAAKNKVLKQMAAKGLIQVIPWKAKLADGIHPTGQGYKVRAAAIRKAMRSKGVQATLEPADAVRSAPVAAEDDQLLNAMLSGGNGSLFRRAGY